MRRSGDRLFVWDWERSSRPLPMGFDVLHYWFESAFHKEGWTWPTPAEKHTERRGRLQALGIPGDRRTLFSLFLLERSVRLEEGRAAGMPVDERLLGGLVDAAPARRDRDDRRGGADRDQTFREDCATASTRCRRRGSGVSRTSSIDRNAARWHDLSCIAISNNIRASRRRP